jgi:hypothetical protein
VFGSEPMMTLILNITFHPVVHRVKMPPMNPIVIDVLRDELFWFFVVVGFTSFGLLIFEMHRRERISAKEQDDEDADMQGW